MKRFLAVISIFLVGIFLLQGCKGKGVLKKISDFTMTLDVNETEVSVDLIEQFSVRGNVDIDTITATIIEQGDYGTFSVTGETLTYLKTVETNATDVGVIEINDGTQSIEINVTIISLYWTQVSAGYQYTTAIKSDGTLWSWGDNSYGKLGDGGTTDRLLPVQERSYASDWTQVNAGNNHTIALKTDGTVWSWGRNDQGQLGADSAVVYSAYPTQEDSRSKNWVQVTAGSDYSAAVKSDGTLWAWGSNYAGKLGDNTFIDRYVPTQEASSATNWSQVSAGDTHTTAVKSDGTLWAWGDNDYGRLGDNTLVDRYVPTQEASSATNWSQVSAGDTHTAAVKSDGTLWAWGGNLYGQLGDGTTWGAKAPVQEISADTNWTQVSAGYRYTTAIKSNETLWAWGYNSYGTLGDGTTTNKSEATQELSEATDWSQVSAGYNHTVAIKNDGSLWGWGDDNFGELGGESSTIPMSLFSRNY